MKSIPPDSFSTSASLLARAEGGDAVAWQRIAQLYGPLIYSWARQSGLAADDSADIVQETMLAVTSGLSKFDAADGSSSFRGWLRRITRNKCVDFVRLQVKLPANGRGGSTNLMHLNEDALAREILEVDDKTLAEEKREIVHRALNIMRSRFEKTTWRAFWRTVVDGCSPDEVADELGLTRWNVYKARSRVLQRLRNELDGLESLP